MKHFSTRLKSANSGFSLVEILVATSIAVAVLGLLTTLYGDGAKQAQQTLQENQINLQAQPALDWLKNDMSLHNPLYPISVRNQGSNETEIILLINDPRPEEQGETVFVRWYLAEVNDQGEHGSGRGYSKRIFRQRIHTKDTLEILKTTPPGSAFVLPPKWNPNPKVDDQVAISVASFLLHTWTKDDQGTLIQDAPNSGVWLALNPDLIELRLTVLSEKETVLRSEANAWGNLVDQGTGKLFHLRFTR